MKQIRLSLSAIVAAFGLTLLLPFATIPGTELSFTTSAQAQAYRNMSCGELWYARNAIYARKGYCFKTRRARSVFGPRCYPPFGRLTGSEQRRVNQIVRWERYYGCR